MAGIKFGQGAAGERALRQDALLEAAALYRSHGQGAVEVLTTRLIDSTLSSQERRRCRLARAEVERLEREARGGSAPNALVVYRPRRLRLSSILALFGIRRR